MKTPFNWMGDEATIPGVLQFLAAMSEFGGGILLILGLLTPLAAIVIGCVMVAAAGMVHIPQGHPFVSQGGPSYELAVVYFACMILFLLLGLGSFSLDAILFGRRPKPI